MLQKDYEYAAFLSYSHRFKNWVRKLHGNLELCLAAAGDGRPVFLDQVDLGAGRSWVGQLQQGLDQAERMVLVATPEALASPRVADEWQSQIAGRRDWQQGRLQVAMLVATPLPPFLDKNQYVDFTAHSEAEYRQKLRELLGGLLGHPGKRRLPQLPAEIEVPEAPAEPLLAELRLRLLSLLEPMLRKKVYRDAIAGYFGGRDGDLEGHPSGLCTASACMVLATGDDDPVAAALRMIDTLADKLGADEPAWIEPLAPLKNELESLRPKGGDGLPPPPLRWHVPADRAAPWPLMAASCRSRPAFEAGTGRKEWPKSPLASSPGTGLRV